LPQTAHGGLDRHHLLAGAHVLLNHCVITVQSLGSGSAAPPSGTTLNSFGVTLTWTNPPGTTQYHLQVVPFNGDGPGVNVVRNVETSFTVPPPTQWYGLLPDMTYFWRLQSATVPGSATEADWSAWSSWTFRTPKVSNTTLSLVSPPLGSVAASLTPTLTWANSNPEVFYYAIQVSKDATFNTNPATASAMVYQALLHGGVTSPPNSYRVPNQFPLEPGTAYFWRVRPRVQGDAGPLGWSDAWGFGSP